MTRRFLIALLIILLFTPDVVNAQAKPKRDTSKDKSVTTAQQRTQVKKNKPQTQTTRKRRKSNTHVVQTPKYATYLRVNQLTNVDKRVSSQAGSETFYVNTDGENWNVTAIPIWCRISKYSNYFVLSYNANTSHDERSDWFMVRCDGKEVRVNIKQDGTPLNITAKFNYASLQHNTYWNGGGISTNKTQWLNIRANVTIKGAMNQKCLVVAFITDELNRNIKAQWSYSSYGLSSSNDVYVATEVIPTSDDSQTFNVVLRLPNNAMRLWKKKHKLRCYLSVYCPKTSSYISGANYQLNFKAKNKKGKVTTKKM